MDYRKKHLILIVSLLLITGFLVTSLASYHVSRVAMREQITDHELPLTSDNIYSEIQRDLLSCVFISSLMATDTFVRDWLILGEQDADKISRFLREIQEKYQTYTCFLVSEQTGKYYHSTGVLKVVNPKEERDKWYYRVRAMESDYEINVDPDLANMDAMTIFVNYRIYDYDGEFIGVTGVGLTIRAVGELIDSYQQNYGRTIFFVDKNGDLVLHGPDFPQNVKNIFDLDYLSPYATEILNSENLKLHSNFGGAMTHIHSRHITELDYYLIVCQAETPALKSISQALAVNLTVCAIITLVVLFLTNLTISVYQRRLEKMATTDKLTDIHNRQAFDIILEHALKEVKRREAPLSMIMLDIDHFKKINDTFGHNAGDLVLQNIVAAVQDCIRNSDALGRWGGEEFLVLLKDCLLEDAFQISEKIRLAVKHSLTMYERRNISATISLGIAQYEIPESKDMFVMRADQALYRAKEKGRNRTEMHKGNPHPPESHPTFTPKPTPPGVSSKS